MCILCNFQLEGDCPGEVVQHTLGRAHVALTWRMGSASKSKVMSWHMQHADQSKPPATIRKALAEAMLRGSSVPLPWINRVCLCQLELLEQRNLRTTHSLSLQGP